MNRDILERAKWKEMRGQVKEWWGELTDDDLDGRGARPISSSARSGGSYGYTREKAEYEFDRRLTRPSERGQGPPASDHLFVLSSGPNVWRQASWRQQVVQGSLSDALLLLAIFKLMFRATGR